MTVRDILACIPELFLKKDRMKIAAMCDIIEQMDKRINQLEKEIEDLKIFRRVGF